VTKRFTSSVLSLVFSSAVYYAFHLKNLPVRDRALLFDHYTFLYFITLIVVSLGFYLILEMMKIQSNGTEMDKAVSSIDKIRYFIATKLRYISLLFNITRNGLLRSTFQSDKEERGKQVAVAFKKTLEKAGGIFVKFGQFLSTRSDLFPKSFRDELSLLQERVSSVPVEQIKEIIETQLGLPMKDIFQDFDEKPLAAASIAQVHKARLHSGEEVVVKVLRPNLKKQLTIDINILANFSELLANKTTWARKIGIVSLTEGFIQNLYEEIDFNVELKNMQQMKELEGSKVYIPKTFEQYSTSEMLVMEFLDGVSINQMNRIIKDDNQKQEIINTIFKEMLTEIYDHGIFHGDPHPGNIFLLKNGQPAFIDFGSVGRLSAIQRDGFKWLIIGMNRKNADSMVTGIKGLVENSEEINTRFLEQALSQFLAEHNLEGNLMDEIGKELFDMMSHFGLRFFPDVAGAFRSLITLQGSLQSIDPDFNITIVIDNYLKSNINLRNMTNTAMENLEDDVLNLIPRIRALPRRIDNIVEQVEGGKITFRMSLFDDKANVRYVNSVLALFFTGLTGFALGLIALGALFLAQTEDPSGYSFLNVFGYSGLGLSVTMLIRIAIQSLKRPQ
jgi:ubiquinone biosynthesis protein